MTNNYQRPLLLYTDDIVQMTNMLSLMPPLKRYFQYPMNISLEWSLGLFLYMVGNGTGCIAVQANQEPVYK